MPHRSNLLFLVHRVPFPPNRGDRIRSYQILKRAAEKHRVSLATLADEAITPEVQEELGRLCERVCVIPNGGTTRWIRGASTFSRGQTITEGLFRSPKLAATLRRWCKETKFDAVFVYCSSMVQYVGRTAALRSVPVVVDLVDVDSQKFLDYADRFRGLKRLVYRWEGARLRALETKLPQRAEAIALASEHEAELFRDICPNDLTYGIVNGVDLDFFSHQGDGCELDPMNCVFVGALDYYPNIEGLTWFCQHVWQTVAREHPEARFTIVGRSPAPTVLDLRGLPGVELVGEVDDVRPYVQRAAVSVSPLNIARGIQNKVLEAMSMGKAVLASAEALQGLSVSHGQDVLCADSPESWIRQLLRLLEDDCLRIRLGQSARKFVEQFHSWQVCLQPFDSLLSQAASKPAPQVLAKAAQ